MSAKAGTLICIDSGEYSDYQVHGFFVALREFDPLAERDEYLLTHPDERKRYTFRESGFIAHLLSKGLLLEIEYAELYLGAYGDAEGVRFTPVGTSATDEG